MKRQIRSGAFETNSSSMHAVCISKDNTYEIENVIFTYDEFGWEQNTLSTVHEKASYLITAISQTSNESELQSNINRLKSMLDDYNVPYVFNLQEPTKEIWKDYKGEIHEYWDMPGHIDHGYELIDWVNTILNDGDMLMRYLFGDSFVVTGNDNDDSYFERMYKGEWDERSYGTFYDATDEFKDEFKNYDIFEKGN